MLLREMGAIAADDVLSAGHLISVASLIGLIWLPLALIDGVRLLRARPGVGGRLLMGAGIWRIPACHYRLAGMNNFLAALIVVVIVVLHFSTGSIWPFAAVFAIPLLVSNRVSERIRPSESSSKVDSE